MNRIRRHRLSECLDNKCARPWRATTAFEHATLPPPPALDATRAEAPAGRVGLHAQFLAPAPFWPPLARALSLEWDAAMAVVRSPSPPIPIPARVAQMESAPDQVPAS